MQKKSRTPAKTHLKPKPLRERHLNQISLHSKKLSKQLQKSASTKTLKHTANALSATAEAGHNPADLANKASKLFQLKKVSDKDFRGYMELHRVIPKRYSHAEVLDNSIDMIRNPKNIKDFSETPVPVVLKYQKTILERGHLPTKELTEHALGLDTNFVRKHPPSLIDKWYQDSQNGRKKLVSPKRKHK